MNYNFTVLSLFFPHHISINVNMCHTGDWKWGDKEILYAVCLKLG